MADQDFVHHFILELAKNTPPVVAFSEALTIVSGDSNFSPYDTSAMIAELENPESFLKASALKTASRVLGQNSPGEKRLSELLDIAILVLAEAQKETPPEAKP